MASMARDERDGHDSSDGLDAEGVPDLEGPLPEKVATGDPQEGLVPPGEEPVYTVEWGITAAEERGDEPLAERVKREEPELTAHDVALADDEPLGQMAEPESEVDEIDLTEGNVAFETDADGGQSAEEAAMRVTTQPPGATG